MVVSLALAVAALRAGLALRRLRLRRERQPRDLVARHLRYARPAAVLALLGFLGGPVSARLLRDWDPFASLHGWLGAVAALGFATAATLGWRLQRGDRRVLRAHGLAGLLAVAAGALAAVAGFVLLP